MKGKRGAGSEVVGKVRGKISLALNILDEEKTPVENLLVEQMRQDAAGTLQKLAKFMPQDVNNNHAGEIQIVRKTYVIDEDGTATDRDSAQLESSPVPVPDMGRTH